MSYIATIIKYFSWQQRAIVYRHSTPFRLLSKTFPTSTINLEAGKYDISRLRMKTIRRDRSRCRCCDRKGDEVILEVVAICCNNIRLDMLLSLCPACIDLAKSLNPKVASIPEFLKILWCNRVDRVG